MARYMVVRFEQQPAVYAYSVVDRLMWERGEQGCVAICETEGAAQGIAAMRASQDLQAEAGTEEGR